MRSPTQPELEAGDIAALVREALGARTAVDEARELTGGTFAGVWLVTLSDGQGIVVKVGPPPGARLLRYERGLIAAEASYFRLVRAAAPGVPVPEVLHEGDGWLVTTLLPGRTLADLAGAGPPSGDAAVRAELGAAVAALHRVTGDRFGYSGDRPSAPTWPAAFAAMVGDLLDDAAAWDVPLPAGAPDIRDLIADRHAELASVTRPALLHFDLWDGNVLAAPDAAGRLRLSGIVDGERFLYGDPLLDLVSPALFRRIEDEPGHPFLRGYARATGRDVPLDASARTRLALYRAHLYLVMLAEGPSRGLAGDTDRHDQVSALLRAELDVVRRA
jgi:aminoglycoside phosphotransferase (APT) family kinase protein